MNLYALPNLFCAVACLGIGVFVLTRNYRSPVNVSYSLLALSAFIWQVGTFLLLVSVTAETAYRWSQFVYVGAIFIPITTYHFVTVFLKRPKLNRSVKIIYFIGALIFLPLSQTPYFLSGVHHYTWGYWFKAGPLHPAFLVFFCVLMFMSFRLLYEGLRQKVSESERLRRRYLFSAFIIAYMGAVDFPSDYGIPFYPFGYLLVLIFIGIVAYAIIRHQLMDIEVVIRRTLVFAGLAGSVVAVVSLMTFISQDVLARFIEVPRMSSNIVAAMVIAAMYGRLRNLLMNGTDRYLFQKKYDYKELLKRFANEVIGIVDLRQLVEGTVNRLSETVRLESCSLLLFNKDTSRYELVASRGVNGRQVVLEEREPFITFMRATHEPIGTEGELGRVRFPEAVTNRLKQLHARLCLPLYVHDELKGVLCLGKKKSDEVFDKDDLDILLPLSKTLGIAVSNAQLFADLARTQAEAAQKEKLAVIGTLSAGINHEICNPLGIVKAQCEAFLLDLEDGILIGKAPQDVLDRSSTVMRGAVKQIDRATAITQKLSNFAKPIKEPSVEPILVADEIDEVLLLVGHDLKLEKISVLKDVQSDLPQIVADRRQIQEVLFNLIRNAGQAITPPGTITIRAFQRDGQVRIEIADTGRGIPAEKLGKIYDPFFTTKEPGKGTGLGLFIVRQIVERNKGRISVESAVGEGTKFFLDFPVGQAETVTA